MTRELKSKIYKWRDKHGYAEAKRRIMDKHISESTAQKLLAGLYPGNPKGATLIALELALDED